MAKDELILEEMRTILNGSGVDWYEKRMFGGNCFMVDDKMCFGTYKQGLMVRVDPLEIEELVKRDGAEQMMHNNRLMKGYAWVADYGYTSSHDLEFWINKCLEFNPQAKASKKKSKKKNTK